MLCFDRSECTREDRGAEQKEQREREEEVFSRDRESYGLEVSIRIGQEGDELFAFSRTASRGVADETWCRLHRRGKTGHKQRRGEGWAVALFFEGVSVCVLWSRLNDML